MDDDAHRIKTLLEGYTNSIDKTLSTLTDEEKRTFLDGLLDVVEPKYTEVCERLDGSELEE